MRTLPTNLCPLIGNQCLEDRCAWWDYAGNECVLVTGAFAIWEAAENLEELAQQKGLPGAATKGGENPNESTH